MTTQQIQNLCREMAAEFWDENCRTERFRRLWPDVRQFVGRTWPTHIPVARAILTDMLRRPDTEVHPHMKEKIYEALLDDRARERAGTPAQVGRGPLSLRPDRPGTREKAIFWDGK